MAFKKNMMNLRFWAWTWDFGTVFRVFGIGFGGLNSNLDFCWLGFMFSIRMCSFWTRILKVRSRMSCFGTRILRFWTRISRFGSRISFFWAQIPSPRAQNRVPRMGLYNGGVWKVTPTGARWSGLCSALSAFDQTLARFYDENFIYCHIEGFCDSIASDWLYQKIIQLYFRASKFFHFPFM